MRAIARRIFERTVATGNRAAPLVVRVTLAVVIFPHGMQKVCGWFGGFGFEATMRSFVEGGIPWSLALFAIIAESLGALSLFVGFLGRIAALGIGCVMTVAAWTHVPNGFFMNWFGNQAGEGFEFHLLAIAMALAVIIEGSGTLSVDRLLFRNEASEQSDTPSHA